MLNSSALAANGMQSVPEPNDSRKLVIYSPYDSRWCHRHRRPPTRREEMTCYPTNATPPRTLRHAEPSLLKLFLIINQLEPSRPFAAAKASQSKAWTLAVNAGSAHDIRICTMHSASNAGHAKHRLPSVASLQSMPTRIAVHDDASGAASHIAAKLHNESTLRKRQLLRDDSQRLPRHGGPMMSRL